MKIKRRNYFNLKEISLVVRILTLSDIAILVGFGLISPIFAVFILGSIEGGSLEVAGLASAIYLLAKSIGQIPIGILADKIKGERDDFWIMLCGSIAYSFVPLVYIVTKTPMQLYILQFFYGLAAAMALPTWYAIFTRHIDKNREGMEWSIYSTLVNLGAAVAASLSGFLAHRFGFNNLFVIVSILSFLGSFFLLIIYKKMKMPKKDGKKR